MPAWSKRSDKRSKHGCGMGCSSYRKTYGSGDVLPVPDKTGQMLFALARKRVIDARAPVHLLAAGFQHALAFEGMQRGINHAFANFDRLIGLQPNSLHQLIAIHLARFEGAQDQ